MALPNAVLSHLVTSLLHERNRLHLLHLKARKHSTHETAKGAYEAAEAAADLLAETMEGCGALLLSFVEETPVQILEGLVNQVRAAHSSCEDPLLRSTLEQIGADLAQKLYLAKMA